MENYYKTAARQMGFLFISLMVANFFGYLTRVVLTRKLSPEDFGLFYSIFTVFMFTSIATDLGYGSALIKYVSHFRALKRFNELYSSIVLVASVKLLLGLIVAGLLAGFAPFLATHYFNYSAATPVLYVATVTVALSVVLNVVDKVLTGFKKMYSVALLYLSQKVLFFLIVLGFALFSGLKGALMPAYAFLISMFSFMLFVIPVKRCFSKLKHPLRLKRGLFWKLSKFALPSMLNSVGYTIIGYIDVLILTFYRTLSEVGVYNTVLPTALIVTYFASSVALVFFPIASELWAKGSKKRLVKGIHLLYNLGLFIVIPAALIMLFYADIILRVLFGKEYISGVNPLRILSLGVILVSIFKINTSILAGIGKPQDTTKILLPAAAFNLVLNIFLIPRYGMTGAASATTLSYLIMMVASTYRVVRLIKLRFKWGGFIKIVLNGAVFTAVILVTGNVLHYHPYVNAFLTVGLAGIVYLCLGFLMGIVKLNQITQLRKIN